MAAASVAALALAGCASSGGGTGAAASPPPPCSSPSPFPAASPVGADAKVGMAYDVGGRGDQSFNDSAALGLDKAVKEHGLTVKELSAAPQGETDATRQERLVQLAEGGYNPIIAIGFAYATALSKVASQYPGINFAIVDDASLSPVCPNVTSLVFAEEQGSFLVGSIAAQASKSGQVGFIGGVNVPLIQKFQAGYAEGVKAINADAEVQAKYLTEPPDFSGFNDAAKGQTAGQGMFDAGADVIYAAAGGSGGGVMKAAKVGSQWVIGVDSDQYKQPALDAVKDVILTSMIKHVDVAVYDYLTACVGGACLTGVQTFDLAKGGVGYSTSNPAVEPYEKKTDALAKKIISGEIVVSTKP